jgi:hypothetical protein
MGLEIAMRVLVAMICLGLTVIAASAQQGHQQRRQTIPNRPLATQPSDNPFSNQTVPPAASRANPNQNTGHTNVPLPR